jgi:murein DD-endopeptidase MepM/ murein hydrolase activator NlpD
MPLVFLHRFALLAGISTCLLALHAGEASAEDKANVEGKAGVEDKATRTAAITTQATTEAGVSRWMLTERPVPGKLSSGFGLRPDPVDRRRNSRRQRRRHHRGVDFVAARGTLVHAAGPGIVVRASFSGGYGRVVIIDHGHGLHTRYAHLQRFKTKKGDFLPAGAVLGTVGSSGRTTGPHLHFEVRQDGVALPPGRVINFELPDCSKYARHCSRRSRPNT